MGPDRPEFRLSDAEREEAIEALGEHMRAGRLDIDEYADRTAQVTAAKTRGELVRLFTDLPDPRPAVLREQLPVLRPAATVQQPNPLGLAAVAVPVAAVVAIVLFALVLKTWVVFLLPAVVALIAGVSLRGSRPDRG